MLQSISVFIMFAWLWSSAHTEASGTQASKDYARYFDQLLIVEEYTSRAGFDTALVMYSDIFREYNRVFAKDAYNACQIAALIRHRYFSDFYFQCARSGITKRKLLANWHIHTAFLSDSVQLNALYEKGLGEYAQRIDTALRREMFQRFQTEQKIKGKKGYAEVCTDNFNRILELAKQGNFPGEDVIGISDGMENVVFPTLLHYPYSYIALEPYLTDAVRKGKITPMSILYLYGFNQTRTSVLYNSDIPVDTKHFNIAYNIAFGKRSTDIAEVDKQRALRQVFSTAIEDNLTKISMKYGLDYQFGYY